MSQLKTISSKAIIAKVISDFNISASGWQYDALDWIGDAIGIIGCTPPYKLCHLTLSVKCKHIKIPCPVEWIAGVVNEKSKTKIHPSQTVTFTHYRKEFDTSCNYPYGVDYYSLNPNEIWFSFEEGEITLYYYGLPLDEEGIPCVVDNAKYKEALIWFILWKLLSRGYKHPVYNVKDAMQMWETMYPRAQNDLVMPTPEEMFTMKTHWTQLVTNIKLADNLYNY